MLHFGMSRAVRLLSVLSCRSSKWGIVRGEGGGGFQGLIPGSGSAKQTWTTGEQQAHVHIHHKTSTILYIDIWTSSPGRKLRVKGVKDVSVCTKGGTRSAEPWLIEGGRGWSG